MFYNVKKCTNLDYVIYDDHLLGGFMKAKIVILCLLVASAVAQASELDPYQCNEGPPQFHSYGVINPGETRIVDLKPDCIGYLNPENYMQFIIGVTTPTLGYIKKDRARFPQEAGDSSGSY